ncbi:reticulocalbin-2 [Nephila pilipes]|uniref:Reticulocalbin-3 n=1 Tax=Nephila pilipes TaxID=299642 RepID=A0A8X6IMR1_NEPPI|nr:reticulocalbin-2 [Nephila pilipes]
MLSNAIILIFIFNFVSCVPHTHNSKAGSKEEVEHGFFVPRDSNHYKDGRHESNFDHESVLGSYNAAEEYDHLPPEESKKRLFALAIKMDVNGDNYVDKKELVNWILRSFKMLTEEEAMDELEGEDGDEDGKITWEEHVAETYGIYDDDMILNHAKDSPEELEMLENDRELFKAADLNGDGILEKSEYPGFSHPEEFEYMHQVIYDQAIRKRDKDKDGFLNFEEFVADHHGSPAVPTTEHYALEKDRFIKDFDLDGDKMLNKEEVLLWLIPNNGETAENEAKHLIETSDTDKDGKLSFKEIVDHYDVFVGSEATDFGEQLQKNRKYTDEL